MAQPNVLFILTDDQRFDTIAALGNPHIHTPNLDALVARGTTFTHAHIPGGTSGAVCMPSRAMLNTGRSLFHIEGAGESIPGDHTTMGEHFRANGYRTFGTGKWHNGRAAFARSFTDGGEIFFGGMADHWNVPAYDFDPEGAYDATCPVIDDPCRSKEVRQRACGHIVAGKHSTDLVTDAAVGFLSRYESDEPVFMYVSYLAPHDPRSMPAQFRELYRDETIPLPETFMAQHPFDIGVHQIRDEVLASSPRMPDEVREHIADYYAMVTHLDHALGRLMSALAARGKAENTLVVFAADNGLAVGRHGLFGKQNLYDHSVRVPLIMAGPGVSSGVRSAALCYLFDIFPTLCDLTGTQAPVSVEGRSLAPALSNPDATIRDELYLAYTELHRGLRTQTHKYIEYHIADETHAQLFDLAADPHELTNLIESRGDLAGALRERLVALSGEWGDRESRWGRAFWQADTVV